MESSGRPTRSTAFAYAAIVIAVQWVVHKLAAQLPFPATSAADFFIRATPGTIATIAIDSIGHLAQPLLAGGTAIVYLVALAFVVRRRPNLLAVAVTVATLIGAALDPQRLTLGNIAAAAAIGAGVAVLLTAARRTEIDDAGDVTRRGVLKYTLLGSGLIAAGGFSALRRTFAKAPVAVVGADATVTIQADPAFARVPSLTPRVTSRRDHYSVDINIADPSIDAAEWRLQIGGLVDRELAVTLDDLQDMRTVEQFFTLTCISNPVGGDLIGNARWTGVAMPDVLALARPKPQAAFIQIVAADGYFETYPLADVMRPDCLLAFGMNGLLLPRGHGFPTRLLVPGRYGVRNVKWPTDITIVDRPADGYWVKRGWDTSIPIRTGTRFDVPAELATVRPPLVAAGMAWAGDRGLAGVEVSTDDGDTWQAAQLEAAISENSWRRWQITIDVPDGTYALRVRATDGAGMLQDDELRPPHPAGATGWHRRQVTVKR